MTLHLLIYVTCQLLTNNIFQFLSDLGGKIISSLLTISISKVQK